MPVSNVNSCPHWAGVKKLNPIRIGHKTTVLCEQCHESVMLILSSKRVMDDFYIRQLPLEHQYKIRRERALIYARSEVGVG